MFDTYRQNTTQSDTRDSREKGIRFSVRQETPVYKKFQDFMRPDDNKTELFQMICCTLSKIHCPTQIVTIENSDVKSNCNIDTKNLQLCNHEEADSRMVVHLIDASKR